MILLKTHTRFRPTNRLKSSLKILTHVQTCTHTHTHTHTHTQQLTDLQLPKQRTNLCLRGMGLDCYKCSVSVCEGVEGGSMYAHECEEDTRAGGGGWVRVS